MLAGVHRSGLSGHDRVVLLQARARQLAHVQAQFYADIMSVWEAEHQVLGDGVLWGSEVDDLAAAEIRAGLALTRRSAECHIGLAHDLGRLPMVWAALDQGRIDVGAGSGDL